MYKILFVCTGNICRSPTAEGVLRRKVAEAGLAEKIYVASAGTHGYHIGEAPDRRSVKAAAAKGYDISKQRAQKFKSQHYNEYDLILACDAGHHEILGLHENVKLFLDYAGLGKQCVPDPYYGDAKGFDDCLQLIENGADGLLQKLILTVK